MRAYFQSKKCLQNKIICHSPLWFMDITSDKKFIFIYSKKAEYINYCIFLSSYVHTANWLLPLGTQNKIFFILHSSLQDHIPNYLASLLACSNLNNVTEYQLEMGFRIKLSEIPTWHYFQAAIATNSSTAQ